MLNYYYAKPYGSYTLTQNGKKYKIQILRGNCMWVELFSYKNEKGEDMEQLMGFYNDIAHMKRCFKNMSDFASESDNFVFNAKNLNEDRNASELWKAIRILAEHGKKVTIK